MPNFNKNHGRWRNVEWLSQSAGCRLEPPNKVTQDRHPQQPLCKEEEVSDEHQLCNQERNTGVDRENPELLQIKLEEEEISCSQDGQLLVVKQEMDTSLLTPMYEEGDHIEDLSHNPHIAESQDQKDDKHEDPGSTREAETNLNKQQHQRRSHSDEEYKPTMFKTSMLNHKEEMDPQGRPLDIALRPVLKLHRIELRICKVEEEQVYTDGKISNLERNPSMEQEEQGPPQIKEEPVELCTSLEVEQLVVKKEIDTFMLTPTFEENEPREDQTLHLKLDETLYTEQKESVVNMPIISSMVGGPNGDTLLLSNYSGVVESQDHKGDRDDNNLSFKAKLNVKKNTDESPYYCQICHKDFSSKSKLKVHMKIHTDMKRFVCKMCGKVFRSNGALIVHTRIHTGEKPYICQMCGKGFRQNDTMKRHMRIHTGERPYVCKTCGKEFRQSCHLIAHMKVHTDEKPFVCETCENSFKYKSELSAHVRIHTDEKPNICQMCGKGFKSSSALTVHMRIHTGEKPFVCQVCGKGFGQNDTMKRHMRIHTGETSYVCGICGNDFRQNCHLIAHMKVHTGEKPFVSERWEGFQIQE